MSIALHLELDPWDDATYHALPALPITYYPLPTTCYLLLATRYLPPAACYLAPVSIALVSSLIPGMMKKCALRNCTYDCVAIYVLPKWDMAKQEFITDTWMNSRSSLVSSE